MTPRERMLAAYRKQPVDRAPVAPEFWCYIPARLLGLTMIEAEKIPIWKLLHATFKHYDCDGWGIVAPKRPEHPEATSESDSRTISGGQEERRTVVRFRGRELITRAVATSAGGSSTMERPVKDFESDWPAWEEFSLWDVDRADWSPVEEALETVGDDYLLEAYLCMPFLDFVGNALEGGFPQLVVDLTDHEGALRAAWERYTAWARKYTRALLTHTAAESLFIGCSWSCNSLVGPRLWRDWDKPVIAAIVEEAHALGGLVHLHFHGKCMETAADFAEIGVDCVCPFERPPGGDVADLREVRRLLDGRVTFNGNVHTVETLIRGTPEDVETEVREIIEAWDGAPGLIIGTGDQVGTETPEENIRAMIDAGKRLGKTDTE